MKPPGAEQRQIAHVANIFQSDPLRTELYSLVIAKSGAFINEGLGIKKEGWFSKLNA